MKASQFFISTLKEAPAEAALASHKLMLRAGLIKANASGLGCPWACACCAKWRPWCAKR